MKTWMTLFGASLVCPILLWNGISAVVAQTAPGIGYQKVAEGAEWAWRDAQLSPVWGSGKYDLQLVRPAGVANTWNISILAEGKQLYSWTGSNFSVYGVVDDRLFYLDFIPTRIDATAVAVDLRTGQVLWRSVLKGLPPLLRGGPSPFLRCNMDLLEPVLVIRGWGTKGKFVEIKDMKTGETVGHKVFPEGT